MRKKPGLWFLLSFLILSIFGGCVGPTTDPSAITKAETKLQSPVSTSAANAPSTTAATQPAVTATKPAVTTLPATQPAITTSPVTTPAVTAAPATQPPATTISATTPSTQPPATTAPTPQTQPAATTAPMTAPPAAGKIPAGALMKVHFIDVGQGDAIFIQLPNSKTMLIDAGDNDDGPRILAYLEKFNIKRLDYVVATHPHADHIGGMEDVIEGIPIGQFYMPDVLNTTQTFERMVDALLLRNIDTQIARAGVSILSLDGLKADIIAPKSSAGSNLNDWSAVIKMTYKESSFLFVGDAEKPVLASLSNIEADVLKVGHHGSDTSSPLSFLKKVSPDYAVISAGKNNQYGHPADETLNNLKTIGAKTYRTDQSGNIIISTDGKTIRVDKSPSVYTGGAKTVTKKPAATVAPPKKTIKPPVKSNNSVVKPAPKKPAVVIPKSGDSKQIVYITNTGKKFHLSGCRSLRNSKIKTTRGKAEGRGLTPCKICRP